MPDLALKSGTTKLAIKGGKLTIACTCCSECGCTSACSITGCDGFECCAPCSLRATITGLVAHCVGADPSVRYSQFPSSACLIYAKDGTACSWEWTSDTIGQVQQFSGSSCAGSPTATLISGSEISVSVSTDGTNALVLGTVLVGGSPVFSGSYTHGSPTLLLSDFPITLTRDSASTGVTGGSVTLAVECCGDCATYNCPSNCNRCCQIIKFTFPGGHYAEFQNVGVSGGVCKYKFIDSDISGASFTLSCSGNHWYLVNETSSSGGVGENYTSRTTQFGCPSLDKLKWTSSITGTADLASITCRDKCLTDCSTCCVFMCFALSGAPDVEVQRGTGANDPCEWFGSLDAASHVYCQDGKWFADLLIDGTLYTIFATVNPDAKCPPLSGWNQDALPEGVSLDNVTCEICGGCAGECPADCPCLADNDVDPLGFIRFDLDDGSWIQMRQDGVDPSFPCDFKWSNGSFTPDDWTGTSSAGTRLTCTDGIWTLTYPKGGTTYTYTDETLDSECCMSSDSADWTSSNGVSISTITKDPV